MLAMKYIPLILKQIVRHRTRTILTVAGVATAMFLFCTIRATQAGVRQATQATASDTTLVVYRQNRYCPSTSRLPEHYGERIKRIAGVREVLPIQIVVNNCRTSLDVVTFRGVLEEALMRQAGGLRVVAGSLEAWRSRTDAAALGETLAARRNLRPGDRFSAAGVTVYVAAVVASEEPQDRNVAYVHLPFLQRSAGQSKVGVVTQFNVKVADASQLSRVAEAIDVEFRNDPDPTHTTSEKAFVARAAADMLELVSFTRYLGWGALAAVLALVGNAIVLSVQDRIREHAILQTLGYTGGHIARLIVTEGLFLGLMGGVGGTVAALAIMQWGHWSLSAEGLSIHLSPSVDTLVAGLVVSTALGVVAGLAPAWQASRQEITTAFRAG